MNSQGAGRFGAIGFSELFQIRQVFNVNSRAQLYCLFQLLKGNSIRSEDDVVGGKPELPALLKS